MSGGLTPCRQLKPSSRREVIIRIEIDEVDLQYYFNCVSNCC